MDSDASAKSGASPGVVVSGGVGVGGGVLGTVLNSVLGALPSSDWKNTVVLFMPLISAALGLIGLVASWYCSQVYKRWQRTLKQKSINRDAEIAVDNALAVRNDPNSNETVKQMADATIQNVQLLKLKAVQEHMKESAQSAGVVNDALLEITSDANQKTLP